MKNWPQKYRTRRIGRRAWLTSKVHPPVNNDGITIRTWRLFAFPVDLDFALVTLVPRAEFGRRGQRAPGTWRRALTNWWRYSGWAGTSYCPDRPNLRNGVGLVVPCLQLSLNWTTDRQRAVISAHSLKACAACEEEQRRLWERWRAQGTT
jgi:hypothetical protein